MERVLAETLLRLGRGSLSRAHRPHFQRCQLGFADLRAVLEHYNQVFGLNLTSGEKNDLIQYLKSL